MNSWQTCTITIQIRRLPLTFREILLAAKAFAVAVFRFSRIAFSTGRIVWTPKISITWERTK